ncbi:MAG: hypothetical protein AAF322_02065 [Pseudomonadota bacterium]
MLRSLSIASILVASLAAPALAESRHVCKGSFAGVGLEGVMRRTWLPRAEVWSYTGAFAGSDGARYDFEVNTNRASGVGGAWRNHARHRESRIRIDLHNGGFWLTETDTGRQGRFACG